MVQNEGLMRPNLWEQDYCFKGKESGLLLIKCLLCHRLCINSIINSYCYSITPFKRQKFTVPLTETVLRFSWIWCDVEVTHITKLTHQALSLEAPDEYFTHLTLRTKKI